jgi:predicted metal-dependent HD superfamily phosphohydrolase
MSSFTRARLESSLVQLGIQPSRDLFAPLQAAYSQPGRHYHSTRHIDACLAQLDRHRDLARRPAEVEIALWFHDAIYDTRRGDSELRSADWAADYLASERASVDTIARIHALIMATRHDAPVSDPDQRVLVDVDLGVLGQPARVFDRYDADIRREYHWVPWPQYLEARRAVLNGFLNRPRIYSTATFVERYEARARHNIARAIDALQHDSSESDGGNRHV